MKILYDAVDSLYNKGDVRFNLVSKLFPLTEAGEIPVVDLLRESDCQWIPDMCCELCEFSLFSKPCEGGLICTVFKRELVNF